MRSKILRMRGTRRIAATVLILSGIVSLAAFRYSRSSAAEEVPTGCHVTAILIGSSFADPVCTEAEGTATLSASHDDPTVSKECVITSLRWSWSVAKVEHRATENDAWSLSDYRPVLSHPETSSPDASLKAVFPAVGQWRVTVRVTGEWIGGKADPNCPSCPDCGNCSDSDEKELPVVTVVSGCRLTGVYPRPSGKPGVEPQEIKVCAGTKITFAAQGACLDDVIWSAPGGDPATATGGTFTTKWATAGEKTVTATCPGGMSMSVTVVVYGGDPNQNVTLTVTPAGPPAVSTPDGKGMRTLNWDWSVTTDPAGADGVSYTHYDLSWDIRDSDPAASPQRHNVGSEDFYFRGAPTGLGLNLDKGGEFNEGSTDWIREHRPENYDELPPQEKKEMDDRLEQEYADWFSSNFTTNSSKGTVKINATYKFYACPGEDPFVPPLASYTQPNGLPYPRNQLPPGYPYRRIPNSERKMHRQSFPHLQQPPAVWETESLGDDHRNLDV